MKALIPGLMILLTACQPATQSTEAVIRDPSRPAVQLATNEAYDFSAISPYSGDHADVYAHVDANIDGHLAAIQRWLRQPSISAQDIGIRDMASMLRQDLEKMGFSEADLVPTDGHPGVWGYYDAGADRTLAVYMMYDVQPVNPEDWESPPFEANLVDHELGKIIMARGATNQKGPQRAFLNALESIIAVDGTLPVNIMITAEGEEELGSPHYHQVVDPYVDRLRTADGVLFPFNSQSPGGSVRFILGVKGILYFEMSARGNESGGPMNAEIHGSYKAIVDSPVWELVQALASMTTADGNTVLVPGFYDGVRQPSVEESMLINAGQVHKDENQARAMLGVSEWIDGKTGTDATLELLFQPTLNIDGIWAGYTGEGVKTILPHEATAKVDTRLPPDLDPDETLARIRAHLDANGFEHIELRKLSGYPSSQTSIEAPAVQAASSVFLKYADELIVEPRIAGSAPFYQFTDRLGLPLVPAGMGFGTGAHAPNEIMLIEPADGVPIAGLADIEKAYVDFVYALATR